jgi:hypothetical protein
VVFFLEKDAKTVSSEKHADPQTSAKPTQRIWGLAPKNPIDPILFFFMKRSFALRKAGYVP